MHHMAGKNTDKPEKPAESIQEHNTWQAGKHMQVIHTGSLCFTFGR